MTYEDGVGISILISLCVLIYNISLAFTTSGHNLRRAGLRYSWMTGAPTPMEESDLHRSFLYYVGKFILVVIWCHIISLLSWITVISYALGICYRYYKDSGTPATVKESRWRLKNIELSFEQVIREFGNVARMTEEQFQSYRQAYIDDMFSRGLKLDTEY